jgi:cytochrome c553
MSCHLRFLASLFVGLIAATAGLAAAEDAARDTDPRVQFFEKKVRPLLAGNCYNCHSATTNSRGGLRLDDRNGMIVGGDKGPAIVPGQPEKSLLLRAVHYADKDLKMPPDKQLSEAQVADLTKWIRDGAAWPGVKLPASLGIHAAKYEKLRKEHWAWQPLRDVALPPADGGDAALSDVDRFLLAKLREKGLQSVGEADRAVLIRRVTFDLTGLPPTPAETDAFLADPSPDAFAKVVDRLLASPAFGERWGRHWLDLARYAESSGPSRNMPYPHAWRYRDWVIDAFNKDKPYDQFIREQVAGDLLPAASEKERDEHLVATGFLAVGVKDVNQRFKVRFIMDNVDEQIDAVGRAVLALTVSCARCHDHKFDPIPTTDYYALAGIFRSTELCAGLRNKMGGGGLDYYDPALLLHVGPPTPPTPERAEKLKKTEKQLADARANFESLRGKEGDAPGPDGKPKRAAARQKMNQLQSELFVLNDPAANGPVALGVRDAKAVADTEIRIRGEAEKLGPVVPRGFLSAVPVPDATPINPKQSGRLELARWLTSEKNPLTPRVIVNRIWQHLFGQGLVTSVDNFGVTGDVPSHPELLDYLAARFVREGWSVKKLVRELVLTRAYRLGSEAPPADTVADPANRLVWRHSPRRLDAEEIRDATLAISGDLDRARPAGSPARDMKVIEMSDNGPEAQRIAGYTAADRHRSVYLPLLRGLTPRPLEVFDFADQGLVTGSRDSTTVAPQALYVLNDPFVRGQSRSLADRILQRADLDDAGRVSLAYRLTLGRIPTATEVERVESYLADYESAARATARPAKAEVAAPQKKPAAEPPVPPADPKTAAWASFCQALLASAEFRYVR